MVHRLKLKMEAKFMNSLFLTQKLNLLHFKLNREYLRGDCSIDHTLIKTTTHTRRAFTWPVQIWFFITNMKRSYASSFFPIQLTPCCSSSCVRWKIKISRLCGRFNNPLLKTAGLVADSPRNSWFWLSLSAGVLQPKNQKLWQIANLAGVSKSCWSWEIETCARHGSAKTTQ